MGKKGINGRDSRDLLTPEPEPAISGFFDGEVGRRMGESCELGDESYVTSCS